MTGSIFWMVSCIYADVAETIFAMGLKWKEKKAHKNVQKHTHIHTHSHITIAIDIIHKQT